MHFNNTANLQNEESDRQLNRKNNGNTVANDVFECFKNVQIIQLIRLFTNGSDDGSQVASVIPDATIEPSGRFNGQPHAIEATSNFSTRQLVTHQHPLRHFA